MKNNIRLKIRDLVRRGGSRYSPMKLESPRVTATSAMDKLGGNIAKQDEMNQELVDMNKKLSGGAVVVPQMQQAGSSGNNSIKQQIGSTLQGGEDGAYDEQVLTPDEAAKTGSTLGGVRRRKTRRRKRRKNKRKSKKKRRKSRRKSKRKRRRSKKRRK